MLTIALDAAKIPRLRVIASSLFTKFSKRRYGNGLCEDQRRDRRIQSGVAEPRLLSAQLLTVQYLTRPEIVRNVLPPGLEPTE